jgi:ABC-type multidrug transport system ATPase subunit
MKMIEVKSLVKKYNKIHAVNGIDFDVEEGKFFAFLGENGAGKSTTINILATLLKKTSGEVRINGNVLDKKDELIRKDIGIVFQQNMLDDFLTVKENLLCRGTLYGYSKNKVSSRINELSNKIGIIEILDRKYGELSGGQKRRADIARALISKPKILILDEPTTGLDPHTRKNVWDCIMELRKEQSLTLFLTTHYMEEAANADQIIIIDKGKIIENDTPMNLKIKYSSDKLYIYPKNKNEIVKQLGDFNYLFEIENEKIVLHIKNNLDAIEIINGMKNEILGFELIKGNLDQVFMTLIEGSQKEIKNA